jgi:hypothetical protein
MSEEVQETAAAEATTEAPVNQEQAPVKKKINMLTKDELAKKIKKMEEANQTGSVYFKHLMERKRELEA